MNLENFMFHQGNGVSNNSTMNLESSDNYFMFPQRNGVSSNNSNMNLENLDNLMFHQGNGVSNNVDPRIPVVPERSYMQRPCPMLGQRQEYQSSNWLESINPVFSQEAPMMQRSNPPTTEMQVNQMPFDMNLLPEQSVHHQLDLILAQTQRNPTQSASWQEPFNNHGILLHKQPMQSFNPNPSEMPGNQIGNEWQQLIGLSKLLPPKQVSQTPDPIPTQIQGNQAQSVDWAETIGLYSNILQDSPKRNIRPNIEIDGRLYDCESSMQGSATLGVNGCLPQNANSHLNNYGRDVATGNLQLQVDMRVAKNALHAPADGEPYRYACPTGMLLEANSSYFYNGNNWEQQKSATSVQQQQERTFLGINQTDSTLEKKPSDGFHISSQPLYNFASPSHVEYAAASSTTNCLKNPPVTPEKHDHLRFSEPSATEHSFVIERWSPEKDKQDSILQIREGGGIYSNQPSTGVIASPSNSTSLKEKVPEDGAYGGIDLSGTPQQKTPKRKKHRPKVVREGKTKRPSKPAASKTEVSSDKPTGKRKYVRRKGLETSTPPDNEKGEFEASTSRSETKSCRRELNFNSEQKEQEEPQEINKNIYLHGSHLNLNSQETTPSTGLNSVSVVPTAKKGQQNTDDAGKLQSRNSWSLIAAANQRIANEAPRLERKAHLGTAMDRVNPRSIKTQNGIPYQSYEEYEHSQENHVYLETEQTSIQENLARTTYKTEMQLLSQSGADHISGCQVIKDKTGQKRDYINISEQASSQYSSGCDKTGRISEICNLEAYKRMKLDEFHRAPCSLPSLTATAENGQWRVHCRNTFSCSTETEVYGNRNNRENVVMENQFHNAMAVGNNCQKSRSLVAEILHRNRMMRETFQQKTETHVTNLLTGATYKNMESLPQRVPATIVGNTTTTSRSDADMKSQTRKVESSILEVSGEKVLPQKYKETAYLHSSRKARGKKEVKIHANTIEEIIRRLEVLGISDSDQQQGALVPYEGHGTLVPFAPIRRRKPRPRVDLDSETITQWNLLMGKTGNEGEETGLDKEKWWEAEREVFRGRVDTFIARMHLVQGDRRFSRWKGSVVDSVIGVFLTQNVSDHLSSSAFMSLAAQFPLRSATTEMTSCRTHTSAWIEEPEVQIIDPDGTIAFPWGTLTQPLHKHDSTASSQYFEQLSENLITAIGVNLAEDNNGTTKDVVSSQNSSDSIILQASEDMRNSSDSEVEYQTIFPISNNQNQNQKKERADTFWQNQNLTRSTFPRYQQIDNLSCLGRNPKLNISKNVGAGSIDLNVLSSEESFDQSTSLTTLNLISDSRVTESYFSVSTGNQSMSSFHPSEAEATKSQGVFPVRMGAESVPVGLWSSTTKETGMPKYKGSSMDRYSAASHNVNSQLVSHFGSSQPSTNINQTQSLTSFHFETSTAVDAQRPDEAHSKQQTGNLFPTGENFGSAGSKISNERRKKNDVNKMKEVDWDELRKEVLRQGTNTERGKDKMDSMDYEALCHADVSRISDAIRERGMNNMLAERINAFLNRLVRDHGSIDLEWLRDVPPDKAKDYLLSIRGLGLKSVECIRLLSLHSMAFPVDTNVGRIAVRLGWVPLQPLPESLQLHLLEMYPILESIQKYIWPRLCKLDQRTLYELHYQMITFGKVFCTKSRPNCNVCPMKGECRHFASAFASARLALPGPEEKGMVSFNPIAPTEDRRTIMEPLLLASGESSLGRGLLHFSSECEPIVEEPTTPEIYTEETESDIEDLLSEDPNEIPVIKFSLEALKANVQNIIQEQNMEISEGDLSKALVALNPATASIPAPKLKNVSRLRTEHHVYELPDGHPIIKEMDRREPDDPSPYLLAIWTPGETADSIQPNEKNCTLSGSGRLCDEKTCFQCNSVREADSQMVRGTILIPCRTAMRGSFPLNGTYFQVNEVFADHESSMNPIAVPRDSLWHLRRRTVYFGTSVTTIFRGMPIEEIQYCFWRGFVCVRGFDRKFRAPRPLMARLHFAASRLAKNKKEGK